MFILATDRAFFCVYIMDCHRIVCAYLLMLVRWGLFDKVELHFGLKGHTHDGRLPRNVLSVLPLVRKHMLAFDSNILVGRLFHRFHISPVQYQYPQFDFNNILSVAPPSPPPFASRSPCTTLCYAWRSNVSDACQFDALLYLQRSTRFSPGEWFHL